MTGDQAPSRLADLAARPRWLSASYPNGEAYDHYRRSFIMTTDQYLRDMLRHVRLDRSLYPRADHKIARAVHARS